MISPAHDALNKTKTLQGMILHLIPMNEMMMIINKKIIIIFKFTLEPSLCYQYF